jgi:phosphoglycolate phosphatase-like HAD superfamily hydrolase
MTQNTIAVICDCDETLAPDTTSTLLEENGIDVDDFWNKKLAKLVSQGWDPPIAWMTEILHMIQNGKIKQDTNKKLVSLGKKIKPYDGVPNFIPQLESTIKKNNDFVDAGINIEFYIISSGLEDLIKGSILSKYFTDIFGGTYSEDPNTGKINNIKSIVTFTEKTKFLYAINKGIKGKDLRKKPFSVNDALDVKNRRIPFEYMVYLGDSPGDIPCFSAVKGYGGNCIGIVGKNTVHKGYQLARGKRTTVGPYSRNYKHGSDLRNILDVIITKIGYDIVEKKKLGTS